MQRLPIHTLLLDCGIKCAAILQQYYDRIHNAVSGSTNWHASIVLRSRSAADDWTLLKTVMKLSVSAFEQLISSGDIEAL